MLAFCLKLSDAQLLKTLIAKRARVTPGCMDENELIVTRVGWLCTANRLSSCEKNFIAGLLAVMIV